jgi:hypothetical protein
MSYSTRRIESLGGAPVKGFDTSHGKRICMLHVDEASLVEGFGKRGKDLSTVLNYKS